MSREKEMERELFAKKARIAQWEKHRSVPIVQTIRIMDNRNNDPKGLVGI